MPIYGSGPVTLNQNKDRTRGPRFLFKKRDIPTRFCPCPYLGAEYVEALLEPADLIVPIDNLLLEFGLSLPDPARFNPD